MRSDGLRTRAIMLALISGVGDGQVPTSTSGLVKLMGMSRGIVYKYTKELEFEGIIYRNRFNVWVMNRYFDGGLPENVKSWIEYGREQVRLQAEAKNDQLNFLGLVQA